MTELIPRTTLTQIAAHRNRALDLYGDAHDLIMAANAKLGEAGEALRAAAPTANLDIFKPDDRVKLFGSHQVAERAEFMSMAVHMVDADVWTHVVNATDLQRLMDKKAKDTLREQLRTAPAEFTEETVLATLQEFAAQAGDIFRRGIAEVFSNLDRRFRSHDGFKVGSRVILSRAFGDFGSWNYHRQHRDTLQDIERTFHVLEGKPVPPDYAGVVGAIDAARRGLGFGAAYTELETEYYRVRIFLNGNCHLWFKRKDLVAKVNKLLAEYYGAVIPDGQTPEDDGGLHEPKRDLAPNFAFFPSPPSVVRQVIEAGKLWRRAEEPPLKVLEPSAGTGNIAFAADDEGAEVECIEVQAEHALALRVSRRFAKVVNADFLSVTPVPIYDRVLMNPPFYGLSMDIDHVVHAMKFLKPDGRLVSVMPAGIEYRENKKAVAFRELMTSKRAHWSDLPAGSFREVGTNVNTTLLSFWNDGREGWR